MIVCSSCKQETEKAYILMSEARRSGRKYISDKKYCFQCFKWIRITPGIVERAEPDRGPLGSFLDGE